MVQSECCRSCGHCLSAQGGSSLWCRLRKIKLHSDIAPYVFCHHWTKSAPLLPKLDESDLQIDRQLDLGGVFSYHE